MRRGYRGCAYALSAVLATGGCHSRERQRSNPTTDAGSSKTPVMQPDARAETTKRTAVERAIGGDVDASPLAAGPKDTCVVRDGTVWCWGSMTSAAVVAVPGTSKALSVAVGDGFACMLQDDHHVLCWGGNDHGQLGDGTTLAHKAPTEVKDVGAASIAAGDDFVCAITNASAVVCWGNNVSHQLGRPDLKGSQTALVVDVRDPQDKPDAKPRKVVAHGAHTCALLTSGDLRCWGSGTFAPVRVVGPARGDPSLRYYDEDSEFPDSMASGVSIASLGNAHTCIAIGATLECWGMNDHWQLGTEHKDDPSDPMNQNPSVHQTVKLAPAASTPPLAMAAGLAHQCLLTPAGTVQCWGANDLGQLGDGTSKQRAEPAEVSGVTEALAIAAGANHTCALTKDGTVWCWGDGSLGQLGDGKVSDQPTAHAKPQRVNWSL